MLDETVALQAHLRLLQGRTKAAAQQLATVDLNMPERLGDHTQLLPLIQVRCLLAQGGQANLHAASDILRTAGPVVRNVNHCPFMIEMLALEALVQSALGQAEVALEALQEAVHLAEPGGFVRTFVDMGSPMVPLLTQLVERGIKTDYLGRVLAAFEGDGTPAPNSLFP